VPLTPNTRITVGGSGARNQRRRRRTKLLDDDALETRLVDRIGTTQPLHRVVRRGNAEVRFDQHALHFFERDSVHRAPVK